MGLGIFPKKYYRFIIRPEPKQIRINNLVTKSLSTDIVSKSPFATVDDVETITITDVFLNLASTSIEVDKTSDAKINEAIADCFSNHQELKLGRPEQSKTPYHTLVSKKGIIHFKLDAKNCTMEFLKIQDCLSIRVAHAQTTQSRIAFNKDDQVRLASNSEILCNLKPISQDQDWYMSLSKLQDIFLVEYEPRGESHMINFYFKQGSLKTPKPILAISGSFQTEMKNLLFTDAKGLISIGKEHIKLEEYDVLEIKDSKAMASKLNLDMFQLSQDGIVVRANGVAADVRLNGEQLIKSALEDFVTKPIYFPILATLIIIISNMIGYLFKRLIP